MDCITDAHYKQAIDECNGQLEAIRALQEDLKETKGEANGTK